MKFFVLTFLVLAAFCELNNAGCLRDDRGKCKSRTFPPPEPREIHYLYRGESCDCPKHHDVIIQKIQEEPRKYQKLDISYHAPKPVEEKLTRYLFDVRIEQPVVTKAERKSSPISYQVQTVPEKPEPVRYKFDTRIEEPVAPCEEKPWQGLVTQVDRISMPRSDCGRSDHPKGCGCGCKNPSHTRKTCNCRANNDVYTIPVIYGDETPLVRPKRDANSPKDSKKTKRRELQVPKFKKIDPKELKAILRTEHIKLKLKEPKKKISSTFYVPQKTSEKSRRKRKEGSPCAYTYESCDPSRKTESGCPLCYKCRCEPAGKSPTQKFSIQDIKIPYRIANKDEPFLAATNQEYDREPGSYIGLNDPDLYRQYIHEIIKKYPEHMGRRMPDVMDQQKDFNKFSDELAAADNKIPVNMEKEDIRYKMIDSAKDFYKMYKRTTSKLPKKDGLKKKKRGTVLEVIEMTSEEMKNFKKGGKKIKNENLNASE